MILRWPRLFFLISWFKYRPHSVVARHTINHGESVTNTDQSLGIISASQTLSFGQAQTAPLKEIQILALKRIAQNLEACHSKC